MNSERSQRRDWQRTVAIGLGRPLTRAEMDAVAAAWRTYKARGAADYRGPWPNYFVTQFGGNAFATAEGR